MSALTTRLTGLLRRIKPERTVRVSATGKTAKAPKPVAPPERAERAVTSLEELTEPKKTVASARRTGILSHFPGAKRDERLDNLQEGFTEVVDLMQTVRVRLDEQSDRSDRLMEIMSRLPEAIDALPETNRNQARMLEALQTHLDRQDRQSNTLNKTLGELAQSTEHQGQVMSVIQGQIETNHRTDQEMLRGFGAMSQMLERLNESSHMSAQTLERVTSQSSQADANLKKLMKTNTRNMTILSAASWVMAMAAMGAAIYAGWAITSLAG